MMRCSVCGSPNVRHLGPLHAPTLAQCTFCGATEDLRPQAARQDPAPPLSRAPVAGGCALSRPEQDAYARMFGLDQLEALLGRGPEG